MIRKTPEDKHKVTAEIDKDLINELKHIAIDRGQNLTEILTEIIQDYVEKELNKK
ncbi:MAG: ribbon-helix-helix protein, CopG family [Candidatus Nitrosocosmicus sp.]|nr:ribbon-helix-helix protein, CopG family [Candidatus Nitrosocosmicus sp.]